MAQWTLHESRSCKIPRHRTQSEHRKSYPSRKSMRARLTGGQGLRIGGAPKWDRRHASTMPTRTLMLWPAPSTYTQHMCPVSTGSTTRLNNQSKHVHGSDSLLQNPPPTVTMSPAALDWKSSRKSRRDRRWAALVMLFGFTLLLVALLVASHHQVAAVNDVLQKRAGATSDGVQSTLKDDGNPSSAGSVLATPSSAVLDAVQTGGPAALPFMSNSEPFPPYEEYAKLIEASSTMPDLIFVPFDVAVKQDSFQGWELDWIANATFNAKQWGKLEEPKIDFVYTWVNGSDEGFQTTKKTYELNSTLNDPDGEWLKTHGTNRYRDWSELKYSIRSVDLNAPFRNRIQVLVNAVDDKKTGKIRKQHPAWLKSNEESGGVVQVLSQEEFFAPNVRGCLPAFNSLTIENQLHNTPSDVDRASSTTF
ncbi:hypothetical protein FH972_026101 [Carpinus fangiana]|uniref:Uncharacterized protein n=1 Tax=Carpinus fangiana TaxID=176857 RepID=A0A5N6L2Z2_9ROSI|nr:hypothetical protein FH972_026101 [Carpinus fangiana]